MVMLRKTITVTKQQDTWINSGLYGNDSEYLREHIRTDYLCFEHRSHLIFYKKSSEGVFIVRTIHNSMDAQTQVY